MTPERYTIVYKSVVCTPFYKSEIYSELKIMGLNDVLINNNNTLIY